MFFILFRYDLSIHFESYMHYDAINLDFYSNSTIITPPVEATEISVELVENKIDYLDKGFSSGSQPTDVARDILVGCGRYY